MYLSIALAAAIAAQTAPTASTEMLGIDVPDEFQVANHQRNEKVEIIELVVQPETVDSWSMLITSLLVFNGAQTGLEAFYSQWRDGMHKSCPGMNDVIVRGSVDGHMTIRSKLSCPKNPETGKPENLTAFLVQGDANLMMAQVAFRRATSRSDTSLIEHVAKSLKVCVQKSLGACSARPAIGFVPDQ